jgi:hypothetical protein
MVVLVGEGGLFCIGEVSLVSFPQDEAVFQCLRDTLGMG